MEHLYFMELARIFYMFCVSFGNLNYNSLTNCIPLLHLEQHLISTGLNFPARFLYHHLTDSACRYSCGFCRMYCHHPHWILRHYCNVHCRTHHHFNRIPCHFSFENRTFQVTRLSVRHPLHLSRRISIALLDQYSTQV